MAPERPPGTGRRSSPATDGAWVDDAADALVDRGWFHRPSIVGAELVDALNRDLDALIDADRLHRAGIGREHDFQVDAGVRRDWIFWLDRSRPAQAELLEFCERLRLALNRRLMLGLFEFEAHLALYPVGAYYRRHFDSFRGAANRMVSLVVHLNRDWRPGDGGELVLHGSDGGVLSRIQPRAGTLVLFLSEDIEHEVLPAAAPRASVAGWFRRNTTTADVVDPPR